MATRVSLILVLFAISLTLTAQPARETLLQSPEVDDEDVRPSFKTFTPAQVHEAVTVSLVDIEYGDMRVPAIGVQLPDADNDAYAAIVFDSIEFEGRDGAPIAWDHSAGMISRSGHQTQQLLLGADGESVPFAKVKGRVVVWYPTSVHTRSIKASQKDALAKEALFIDGPYVRYRVDPKVARVISMSDIDPVRAYDAAGKRLKADGGAYPDGEHEGFELRPFRGDVARVDADGLSEMAGVEIEYELVPGSAPKLTKTPRRTMPMAVLDWTVGLTREQMVQELAQRNYAALDRDTFLTALIDEDLEAVRIFLASGVDIEAGETPPLVAAATAGRFEVANLLLDAGANPNAVDSMGVSSLMRIAAVCAASPTIEKLLAHGADPNAKGASPVGPLALAMAMKCEQSVAALQKAGAR